jgi:DNA mismatch repair protein MutS
MSVDAPPETVQERTQALEEKKAQHEKKQQAAAEKAARKGSTPLMRQYYGIAAQHPQALLLFRMGDFYETFDENAETVSRILGITLTSRNNGSAEKVPMAGFPYHALEKHLPKLIQAGHRVAICEQVQDPAEASGVVKRDVVEIVTAGANFHDELLDPKRSNYLAAISFGTGREKDTAGLAYVDATTGEFYTAECRVRDLEALVETIAPSEVLIDKRRKDRLRETLGRAEKASFGGNGGGNSGDEPFSLSEQEDWVFDYDFAYETLLRHFEVHSLKGFGVDDLALGLCAAGAALHYLGETQQGRLAHVRRLRRHRREDFMALDAETKRNLELVRTMQPGGARSGGTEGSLVDILDETRTPMGGRRLRQWLVRPLQRLEKIAQRQNAVEALVRSRRLRENLQEQLKQVGDLERLAGKVATGRAGPRDLTAIKKALDRLPDVAALLEDESCDTLRTLAENLTPCAETTALIGRALVDEPPAKISEGGLIREGHDDELDELRELAQSGKAWVAQLEEEESERTGIPSLKVGFNKVFGYYLEITHTHKEKVPGDYIRKQTLKNSERYITPELKEKEEKILTAEEKAQRLEQDLFSDLRTRVARKTADLQLNASLLAMLDGFASLAEVAEREGYTRPDVTEERALRIEGGRHPVVEATLPPGESFIPNDIALEAGSAEGEQLLLITGPNMAGKSVILRQVGLVVLLAQVGSFVPAAHAEVGLVDRIFTRVGASDNLSAGESTFLVEMNEAANILNNATSRSLILLDEVGRGTSTFDGLSIAWAMVEYLHENDRVAARTLFATHYHELNELAERLARVANYQVQVQEHEGELVFLHKLVPGRADHSYGIEVARMAGLPAPVVARAREILAHLEQQHLSLEETALEETALEGETSTPSGDGVAAARADTDAVPDLPEENAMRRESQMSLFQATPDPVAEDLKEALADCDPDRMTPIEALMMVSELKGLVES